MRTIISAIVDALIDGDKRKRSNIEEEEVVKTPSDSSPNHNLVSKSFLQVPPQTERNAFVNKTFENMKNISRFEVERIKRDDDGFSQKSSGNSKGLHPEIIRELEKNESENDVSILPSSSSSQETTSGLSLFGEPGESGSEESGDGMDENQNEPSRNISVNTPVKENWSTEYNIYENKSKKVQVPRENNKTFQHPNRNPQAGRFAENVSVATNGQNVSLKNDHNINGDTEQGSSGSGEGSSSGLLFYWFG